jgi:hypothetical protein
MTEPCTHPLAIWEMHFSEEPSHHSRVNYVKVGQEKAVDDFVAEMLANRIYRALNLLYAEQLFSTGAFPTLMIYPSQQPCPKQ